ncbi:hypothetical protein NLJ89_g11546 [Agrocybe chaxingu]|uniref:Uncharacterized protein n=1 Tax=Agrocybe chaxingu TaxID=84603 RepID=A0A9W8MP98_9AGAR|nr:hypothetical protein NLJ89_g11546 [Agrocybe chaxingu]
MIVPTLNSATGDLVVRLNSVKVGDFKNLLCILFPKNVLQRPTLQQPLHDKDVWISGLALSTMLRMNELREFCVGCLQHSSVSVTPIEKVVLGRGHAVRALFLDGCEHLVSQDEQLSFRDGVELGMEVAFKVSCLREERLRSRNGSEEAITGSRLEMKFATELLAIFAENSEIEGRDVDLRAIDDESDWE